MARALQIVSLAASLVAQTLVATAAPRSVCYKVTAQAWDADAGRSLPTSPALLERIHRAFGLWQQASRGVLEFHFAGLAAPAYDGVAQVPYDGCIYAVLDGDFNFHGELGQGGFNGTIPGEYKRGYFFLNRDPDATRSGTIIHEIGHALGLPHTASNASAMFSGGRAWGRDEPPLLVEQDGADLRARWAPGEEYSVSGVVETGHVHSVAFVFVVDVRNGRTWSARADHMGRFSVAVARPGEYRLLGKAAEYSQDLASLGRGAPLPQRPGWYVSDGVSHEDPAKATLLSLSDARPAIEQLRVKLIDTPPPFPLTRARVVGGASAGLAFMEPGSRAEIELPQAGPLLARVESHGSDPDYAFVPIATDGSARRRVRVMIAPTATGGERLVVARATDGNVTVGLVGIHVLGREEP